MAETVKAKARREREGWFERYVRDPGLDIGCGSDPLTPTFRQYDHLRGDGDATHCANIPDGVFLTVYASHVLEHLADPWSALRNWFRLLAPGGFLLVSVPHRDLYEKRTRLPSRWNGDHKWFWLPDDGEPPHTLGLRATIRTEIGAGELLDLRVCDDGWADLGPDVHSVGEYSIEAVICKPLVEVAH